MTQQEVNLDPRQMIQALNENLNQRFYAGSRDAAKQAYQELVDGKLIPLMRIEMEDATEVICELALDTSEYVGKLNFGRFRKGLAMMMLGIKNRLDKEQELNIMHSENGEMLFNIPGVLQSDDGTNVIVCGLRQLAAGRLTIRLMYINPDLYAEAALAGRDNAEQS